MSELIADGVFHILGILLAIVGTVFLLVSIEESGAEFVAVAIYLATLLIAMTASAAYNMLPVSRPKWILRRLDHSSIYLLIAGTYSPVMVEIGAWWLLAVVWTVAVLGVLLKVLLPGRYDRASIAIYLAMGWSGALVFDDLVATLPGAVFWLLAIGGIVYSAGVVFHLWNRLRFHNAIWHGFVLAAAALHYSAVWRLALQA